MNQEIIYAARDLNTGKLVSDITNPGRKFWQAKGSAQNAIDKYNRKLHKKYNLKLVTFKLVEIE